MKIRNYHRKLGIHICCLLPSFDCGLASDVILLLLLSTQTDFALYSPWQYSPWQDAMATCIVEAALQPASLVWRGNQAVDWMDTGASAGCWARPSANFVGRTRSRTRWQHVSSIEHARQPASFVRRGNQAMDWVDTGARAGHQHGRRQRVALCGEPRAFKMSLSNCAGQYAGRN